ncbi:MAG: SpoIVB peptidase S55 domain-containing protein [Acidobacteriota bacterium]
MMFRRMTALCLALPLVVFSTAAANRYMSIDEVTPGMTGVGRTVFQGTAIEEFRVQVIGVLRNTNGPKRDLVLARIEGGPLAKTGVIAGMSGSPVYIDGRLLGAVSYSLGQFATEPIAGITPIEEMIAATTGLDAETANARPRAPMAANGTATVERAVGAAEPFALSASRVRYTGPAGEYDGHTATALRPIATPLVAGGFDLDAMQPLVSQFARAGFVLSPGGSAASAAARAPVASGPLRPGDPLGVALITGDLVMGATGTVTEIDDDRVYAFGHPFYNVGPARFPMTRAFVHTVLPSLLSSFKLSSIGEVIGTIQQDRATGVSGTLGAGPRTIAINVAIDRAGRARRTFAFSVVDDPLLAPLLVYTAMFNLFSQQERDYGAATYALQGQAAIRGQAPVAYDDIFVGDQPGVAAAAAVAAPMTALLANDRERVDIESIDLTIASTEQLRSAVIERIWIDATTIRPGRTVPLKILLRTWRGEDVLHTVPIPIPLNGDEPLTLMVTDGPRLAQWEAREARPAIGPENVAGVITRLNDARHANRIYVRLLARSSGAVVASETLPGLPASVLSVMESDRAGSGGSSLQQVAIGSWEIRTPLSVSGQRTLTLSVDGRRHRP